MTDIDAIVPVEPEEGGPCPAAGCDGKLALERDGCCSCHLFPPCNACVIAYLFCPRCGWASNDDPS